MAPASRPWPPRIAVLALSSTLLLGACNQQFPSVSPSARVGPSLSPASASPSPSASTVEAACTTGDIRATGGPWGGAAGSRGSDIVVEHVGAAPCLLPAAPTIALLDQAGTVLLSNTPVQAGIGPSVAPAGSVRFSLLFGNWCEQSLNLPLHFSLALATGAVDIEGLAVSTTDELPPCNGVGQPAALSATDWAPS